MKPFLTDYDKDEKIYKNSHIVWHSGNGITLDAV
jgi:hypothetical protein